MNRRTFIKNTTAALAGMGLLGAAFSATSCKAAAVLPKPADNSRVLIAYFSYSGNTRVIAEKIQAATGAKLIEIKPKNAYPADHNDCVAVARKELDAKARPEIIVEDIDMSQYDTVILGYPNWWATYPMPVASFIEQFKLNGKNIAPFCTHEGSGMGRSDDDLEEACPKSTILEDWTCRGRRVKESDESLMKWLKELPIQTK